MIKDLTPEAQQQRSHKAATTRRNNIAKRAARTQAVATLTDQLDINNLGPTFLQTALEYVNHARQGLTENPPQTALDRKHYLEGAALLHKMARLELGESTENRAVNVTLVDLEARLEQLRKASIHGDESDTIDV